jgi:predicted Holliday junction resolvase-like endonuclease
MLTVLFFTILCGALGVILFQCHALKTLQKLQKEREEREEREEKQKREQKEREEQQEREKKEREERQEREEKEKQEEQARQERNKKKSTEALLARWKRESKKEKTMKDEGIYHLRLKKGRSTEDEKELAWYRAQIDQDHATAIMSMEPFMMHTLYSQSLIKEYNLILEPSTLSHPPGLGRWLSALPDTKCVTEAMRINAYAPIGTVIPWRQDIVRDNLHVDDVLVRVNVLYRWIHLNIIRYATDSRDEMICSFLKELDVKMFTNSDDKINFKKGVWMIWDPITKTLVM